VNKDFVTIAIMAESGHGKDFCGCWMVDNMGFLDLAFADHIKRLCRIIFKPFSDDALWGEPALRNTEVPINWEEAEYRFTWGVDDWIMQITNLSIEERAEYKNMVRQWFNKVRVIAWQDEVNVDTKVKGNMSPRVALQLLGTEYGRSFKQHIWSGLVLNEVVPKLENKENDYQRHFGLTKLSPSRPPIKGVVITDCRYLSEMEHVQEAGGYVIKIVRNSKKGKANEALVHGVTNHNSEVELQSIPNEAFDVVLEMDDGAENVYPRLQKMFDEREFETLTAP